MHGVSWLSRTWHHQCTVRWYISSTWHHQGNGIFQGPDTISALVYFKDPTPSGHWYISRTWHHQRTGIFQAWHHQRAGIFQGPDTISAEVYFKDLTPSARWYISRTWHHLRGGILVREDSLTSRDTTRDKDQGADTRINLRCWGAFSSFLSGELWNWSYNCYFLQESAKKMRKSAPTCTQPCIRLWWTRNISLFATNQNQVMQSITFHLLDRYKRDSTQM